MDIKYKCFRMGMIRKQKHQTPSRNIELDPNQKAIIQSVVFKLFSASFCEPLTEPEARHFEPEARPAGKQAVRIHLPLSTPGPQSLEFQTRRQAWLYVDTGDLNTSPQALYH